MHVKKSLIHVFSLTFSRAAGSHGPPQAIRGRAEGSPAGSFEKEQGGRSTERRGAETSGQVTEGGGQVEERCQRETESEHLRQAAEPRAGGATQQAPSDR